MTTSDSANSLYHFFLKWVGHAFEDLQMQDFSIVQYLANVLVRFARKDALYQIKNTQGESLQTVVEMLIEADSHAHMSKPEFDPFSERNILKHIGDYTLFMTGIFREFVDRLGVTDFYLKQGETAYFKVYEFDKIHLKPKYEVFLRLFNSFEMLSGSLHYMKQVYFRPELYSGTYRLLIEQLSQW